jgi:hypothetical protein
VSAYAFPLYAFIHFCIFVWCLYMARVYKAPGAALVALIAAGLVYDNLIISLGMSIGIGDLLQDLSWPRFAMHALLTPLMIIAVTQIGVAGGVRWAADPRWRRFVWVLVVAMIILGVFESLYGLETVPACFDGIIRYTANLYPSHFCFEGQEAVAGSGPPIPAIVGNIITLIIGFALWRRNGWPWLMVGAIMMFAAAAVPIRAFGMVAGNGGEVLLQLCFAATVTRFGRRKQPVKAPG